MSLKVSEKGGGSNFSILPEGSYAASCYMVVDLGMQKNAAYGNSSRKVLIGWEIADEYVEIDGEKKPRVFSSRYTASLNEKSILRKDLAAWRGRDFTEEELMEFNLANIVGAPCLIQIIHKDGGNGKTYANLASIMKLPKGMAAPVRTLENVVYDIDEDDPSKVDDLPEWIAKTIKESDSYTQRVAEFNKPQFTEMAGYGEGNPFESNGEQASIDDEGRLPF